MQTINTKSGRIIELPSDEEDFEITRQAIEDGTLMTDAQLSQFKPLDQSELPGSFKAAVRRGRPKAEVTKERITIRFSRDVVAHFKATGNGWQTRMDEALKEWIKEHDGA